VPTDVSSKEVPTSLPNVSTFTVMGGVPNIPMPKSTGKGTIVAGGLGNLDVGWLNSRNDHVGKEKEAELWEEAQTFVERAEERRAQNGSEKHE